MSTAIRQHVQRLLGSHTDNAMELGENVLEGGGTGAVLGLISAQRKGGLDIDMGSTEIPMDLAAGGIGLIASIWAPMSAGMRRRVADISKVAFGIGVYRQVEKRGGNSSAHGEFESVSETEMGTEDPILAAARLI